MKNFFASSTYELLCHRLDQIDPSQSPQWGRMSAGQMCKHCQESLALAMGDNPKNLKPNWLVKLLFKKMLYSDKPYRKNAPTPKSLRVTDDIDFAVSKKELRNELDRLWQDRQREDRPPHPVFGHFTKEQWGILQYKHLDHHFRQFGV